MKRRDLLKSGAAGARTPSWPAQRRRRLPVASAAPRRRDSWPRLESARPAPATHGSADYIVVGSGAGGGTVAARLAEAGYTVLRARGRRRSREQAPRTPGRLRRAGVPPARHRERGDEVGLLRPPLRRRRAAAARPEVSRERNRASPSTACWYPRAGTLGGCTAHNAMIFVYPHNSDWDELADLTGDPSWRAEHMRDATSSGSRTCRHRPFERWLQQARDQPEPARLGRLAAHRAAMPRAALRDRDLRQVLISTPSRDALDETGSATRRQRWLDSARPIRTTGASWPRTRRRRPLHAADDAQPSARRHARTAARRARPASRTG